MKLLAVLLFLLLAACVAGLVSAILGNLRARFTGRPTLTWALVLMIAVLSSVVLLRPHEDTFAGLDNSGYRLMAKAFQAGHLMHGIDKLLMEVPGDIRNRFMLLPTMEERNTRDRSFLVKSLDTGETEPFFYPLLPLCAVGFDALVPGDALDYLVPVTGFLFVVILILVGAAYGGIWGSLLALALFVGSPLPVWLLRGFYVESMASVLLALALLNWLTCPEGKRVSRFAYLALGLAISFHPAMVVIALPLMMIYILSFEERWRDIIAGIMLFGVGFSVMIAMFMYACSPYGTLRLSSLSVNFTASASHRITLACGCVIAVVTLISALTKSVWSEWYKRLSGPAKHTVTCLPIFLAILPVLFAARIWSQKEFVIRGLAEAGSGLRLALGVLLCICAVYIIISRPNVRARMALMVVLLALPVFAYLKGAEQMGLWSQRRLLPVYLLLIVGVLPAASTWIESMIQKTPRPMNLMAGGVVFLVLLVAGGANPCRWPAPYTVRCDRGAWNWVEKVSAKIGSRLIFFDYYPYSVPFAVTGKTRALGLCEGAQGGIAEIVKWLAEKARKEEVLLATAYENPGIEEGMALKESFSDSFRLKKITSKGPLPAEKRKQFVDIKFLVACPVAGISSLPVLNKVLDDGPLAVRGIWGRGSPVTVGGRILPARWSREGSGVVGPVPLPGKAVRISLEAAASRDDGIDGQTLRIVPPWDGNELVLAVSNDLTSASGELPRPAGQQDNGLRTGVYRIYSAKPYDPAKAGIKGYESDLGARIHLIRIEAISEGNN